MTVKKLGKQFLCFLLEAQVRRLRKRHTFKVVAVVGSVGKTSTKLAIAKVLGSQQKVRFQEGNYNDRLTVPLVFFGHTNPALFNVLAWLKILVSNERQIRSNFKHKTIVLELGTDGPGQIAEFAYIKPDLAVVTAVTPEHMEFFGTVEAVAEEELSVGRFSRKTIINCDDVPITLLEKDAAYISYGLGKTADYQATLAKTTQGIPQKVTIKTTKGQRYEAEINLLGAQGAKIALGAFAAACEVGLPPKTAAEALASLHAFSGRMRLLDGIKSSVIIDDTYNASPAAVTAALDVLYSFDAPQRIAILGMMNELGETSETAHIDMGNYCDPAKLDYVITIGADAKLYTAPAAEKKGCKVASFDSPYEAGKFASEKMKKGAVILAKGSQNRVFAEEALKVLLVNQSDRQRLVRQSRYWLNVKKQQFPEGEQ